MNRSLSVVLTLLSATALLSTTPGSFAQAPAAPAQTLDFGNHTSETLVGKAWQASEAGDVAATLAYAGKCIDMYQKQALEQQASLTAPIPATEKEKVFSMWALNDVGTALFIRGQTLEKQGKLKEALESYKFLVEKLPYGQCWDPKGWFWMPAAAAEGRLKALEFETAK